MPQTATTTTQPEQIDEPDVEHSEGTTELDRDEIFHVLQCQRRRRVIRYLLTHEGTAEMSDIAEHIAAAENDKTVAALRSEERQRVYIALYQAHLPKMDDVGVIEYEQSRGNVTPTELLADFEPYVDDTNSADEPEPEPETSGAPKQRPSRNPHTNYLFASGGTLAMVLGFLMNAPFLSLLPATIVMVLVSGVFSLLSVTNYLTDAAELSV